MHPVNYLFQDIYRNDWSIGSTATKLRRHESDSPWVRELRFFAERRRS